MVASQIISDTALAMYREKGYHIEEGVFDSAECEDLIRTVSDVSIADGRTQDWSPLMQPHRNWPILLKAMKNRRIVRIAEQLAGGVVWGLQSTWYYGAPGTSPFNLHQDNYLVQTEPSAFVSAWCPMQDVTEEMGALVGYPCSHQEQILPQVELVAPGIHQDPNGARYVITPPDKYHSKVLEMRQGAALFMHSHFIHGSGANRTDRWRRALLLTYIRQGEQFRAGNRAKREAVDVYT